MSLLKATDITKSYSGVQALKGVSFELCPGEVHALVGENGAGKSTLIKIISGATTADSGTLEISGHSIGENNPMLAKSLGVAVIYQQPALFPHLTVAENLVIGLEPFKPGRRVNWPERRRRAQTLLDRIGAQLDPEAVVNRLSMPQQQLVEIARAVGSSARILIMDEPTASLADREVENLFRVISELRDQNAGIVYISHRLEELFRLANRVTVLRDGSAVETREMRELSPEKLIQLMVGRQLDSVFPKRRTAPGTTILEVRQLSHSARIHDVSFLLRAGEILGLAGLVGCGRTELAKVLFGLAPAESGQIRIRGQVTNIRNPQDAVAAGIAYVPEDRRRHGVILEMPVAANTSLAVLKQLSKFGFLSFTRENALADDFVRRFGIKASSVFSPAGNLSGGNQQKVALSRWLATRPAVLILDEPTQGIDVGAKAEIHRLMGQLVEEGMAILMISSELPEILGMSDRIGVMREGTLVAILERAEATQEQILSLALGHASST
jgi:rhamnose transport system ATP-binding protein